MKGIITNTHHVRVMLATTNVDIDPQMAGSKSSNIKQSQSFYSTKITHREATANERLTTLLIIGAWSTIKSPAVGGYTVAAIADLKLTRVGGDNYLDIRIRLGVWGCN